jgi:hypothetical protein
MAQAQRRRLATAAMLAVVACTGEVLPFAGSDAGSVVDEDAALGDAGPGRDASNDAMGADAASPGTDAEALGLDARPGRDASSPDAAAPGPDAAAVEPDAARPGKDAGVPDGSPLCSDIPQRQLFGMNIDPANPGGNPTAAELRAAGARWARIEFKVPLGYAPHDAAISALRASGIRVMLLLDYSSVAGKPASNASDGEWTGYLATFDSGIAAIGDHYQDSVDAWQIWNEPDLMHPGTGYDPGVPAKHFGAMLRDSATTLRARSTRPIVTGGLASGDPGYLQQAQQAAGGLTVDAVCVHPYGQRAPDDWPDPSWGFGNMSALFDAYLAFGKPLWVSEIGTDDSGREADYLTHVYDLAWGSYAGQVERVFWFCWSDAMVSPYGILDSAGNHKAAYDSYGLAAPTWDDACDPPP